MLIQETYRTSGGSWTIPLSEDGSKPSAQLQHFFDGLGVLHKFEFNDGEVKYISRSTADGLIRKAKEQGFLKALVFGLNPNTALEDAQDPCWAKFGKQACLSPVVKWLRKLTFNIC
jgi:torulene dioxygenase